MAGKIELLKNELRTFPKPSTFIFYAFAFSIVAMLGALNSWVFRLEPYSGISFPYAPAITNLVVVATSAVLLMLRIKFNLRFNAMTVLKYWSLPMLLAAGLLIYSYLTEPSVYFGYFILTSIGIAYLLGFLSLLDALYRMGNVSIAMLVAVMNLLSIAAFVLVLEADSVIIYAMLIFALPVLYYSIWKCRKSHSAGDVVFKGVFTKTSTAGKIPTVLITTFVILGFLLSSEDQYRILIADGEVSPIPLLGSFALTLVILIVFCLRPKLDFNRLLFLYVIPLISLALLIASIDSTSRNLVVSFFADSARIIGLLVFIALVQYLSKFSVYDLASISLWGVFSFALGTLLSWTVYILVTAVVQPSEYFDIAMRFVVFAALMVCIILFHKKNMRDGWGIASIKENPYSISSEEKACDILAKRVSLTPRETQILLLMVQGRNNEKISEQLFISRNTTKMHMSNIYKKLGVHSQQEVLDVVSEARKTM